MNAERWKRAWEAVQSRGREAAAHPLARWVLSGVGLGLVAGILILVYWRAPASLDGEAGKITFLQIGTGPSDGPFFAVGGRLAAIVSRPPDAGRCEPGGPCGVEGVLAVVKSSAGSVANVRAVSAHHFQSALVRSTVLAQAFRGAGPFRGEKPFRNLRAVAAIYDEVLHIVASRGAAIRGVADLKGKRVSFGAKGSDSELVALDILRAHGITPSRLNIVYEEPARAAELMLRGQLDAFFFIAAAPSPFIADLADRGAIDIVPVGGAPAEKLLAARRGFSPAHIPQDAYRFNPGVDTLALSAVWVCDVSADPILVHDIAAALFYPGNRDLLPASADLPPLVGKRDKGMEEARRHLLMERATANLPIEIHPGAMRFYREEGVLPESGDGS